MVKSKGQTTQWLKDRQQMVKSKGQTTQWLKVKDRQHNG